MALSLASAYSMQLVSDSLQRRTELLSVAGFSVSSGGYRCGGSDVSTILCSAGRMTDQQHRDSLRWGCANCNVCVVYPLQARPSTETLQLADGRSFRPGVCRTAYVFPGIGLGVIMTRSTRVRDEMILAAAQARA